MEIIELDIKGMLLKLFLNLFGFSGLAIVGNVKGKKTVVLII